MKKNYNCAYFYNFFFFCIITCPFEFHCLGGSTFRSFHILGGKMIASTPEG